VTWAIFTVRRRSLIPAIIGHALFDFTQFIGLYYLQPLVERQWATGST
jgi:membrane protease YdiL (CAAX protease family)